MCYSHDSLGVVSRGRGWIFYKPSYFLTRIFSWVSFSSGYVVLLILASLCFTRHCFGIHAKKKVGKYENMNSSCVLNVVFCLPCVCVSLKTIQRMGSVWRKKVWFYNVISSAGVTFFLFFFNFHNFHISCIISVLCPLWFQWRFTHRSTLSINGYCENQV